MAVLFFRFFFDFRFFLILFLIFDQILYVLHVEGRIYVYIVIRNFGAYIGLYKQLNKRIGKIYTFLYIIYNRNSFIFLPVLTIMKPELQRFDYVYRQTSKSNRTYNIGFENCLIKTNGKCVFYKSFCFI